MWAGNGAGKEERSERKEQRQDNDSKQSKENGAVGENGGNLPVKAEAANDDNVIHGARAAISSPAAAFLRSVDSPPPYSMLHLADH
ncbi:hypothetical protein EMPG_09941 [Blastomyces silverae]|uniref:Uncharacterized protein n=1 Tax=Blastomyces silverae TaxID=2060906 RepID=A0A0H1BCJ8_9EURO|nr:hypothetical protein EMPG_09941 [Blastomyces silverae]